MEVMQRNNITLQSLSFRAWTRRRSRSRKVNTYNSKYFNPHRFNVRKNRIIDVVTEWKNLLDFATQHHHHNNNYTGYYKSFRKQLFSSSFFSSSSSVSKANINQSVFFMSLKNMSSTTNTKNNHSTSSSLFPQGKSITSSLPSPYREHRMLDCILVRHGESEGNIAYNRSWEGDHSLYSGAFLKRHSSLWRLTDRGREQAAAAGSWLINNSLTKGVEFHRFYVSEYIRAMETAGLMNLPKAKWFVEVQLRERDWGSFDVLSQKERVVRFTEETRRRDRDSLFYAPPGGESLVHVLTRVDGVLNSFNRQCSDQSCVVVCHGEVMWAFRLRFERLSQLTYRAMEAEHSPFERIHNAQIIWYSRRNPNTGEISPIFRWKRSVCPWDLSRSRNEWEEIIRIEHTNQSLLDHANKVKRIYAHEKSARAVEKEMQQIIENTSASPILSLSSAYSTSHHHNHIGPTNSLHSDKKDSNNYHPTTYDSPTNAGLSTGSSTSDSPSFKERSIDKSTSISNYSPSSSSPSISGSSSSVIGEGISSASPLLHLANYPLRHSISLPPQTNTSTNGITSVQLQEQILNHTSGKSNPKIKPNPANNGKLNNHQTINKDDSQPSNKTSSFEQSNNHSSSILSSPSSNSPLLSIDSSVDIPLPANSFSISRPLPSPPAPMVNPFTLPHARVLIVTKTPRYEHEKNSLGLRGEELHTELSKLGFVSDRLIQSYIRHMEGLSKLAPALEQIGMKVLIKQVDQLNSQDLVGIDLVVSAGGDGTMLKTASLLGVPASMRDIQSNDRSSSKINIPTNLPLIGVNTDPQHSAGVLCSFSIEGPHTTERVFDHIKKGHYVWKSRSRIKVQLINKLGQEKIIPHYSLNDLMIAESDPGRPFVYELTVGENTAEVQRSSGVLICTGTGSTAWMSNAASISTDIIERVLNDLSYSYTSSDARQLSERLNHSLVFEGDSDELEYFVREPIVSLLNSKLKYINRQGFAQKISIRSLGWDARISFDGIHSLKTLTTTMNQIINEAITL